jgi:hypothetical protein
VKEKTVELEKKFSVTVPEDEICYLASFFQPVKNSVGEDGTAQSRTNGS